MSSRWNVAEFLVERRFARADLLGHVEAVTIVTKAPSTYAELGCAVSSLHGFAGRDRLYDAVCSDGPDVGAEHAQRCGLTVGRIVLLASIVDARVA